MEDVRQSLKRAFQRSFFDYARRHRMLEGVTALDFQLLRTIVDMTSHLEVNQCTTGEWEQAIFQGFEVWRAVNASHGGRIAIDLDARRIEYLGPAVFQSSYARVFRLKYGCSAGSESLPPNAAVMRGNLAQPRRRHGYGECTSSRLNRFSTCSSGMIGIPPGRDIRCGARRDQ